MYAQPAFRIEDDAEITALIGAWPLAVLAVNGADGPVLAHVPLSAVTDAEGRLFALEGHLARANPFWSNVPEDAASVAVFAGPDAYVTPSAYPSKAEHGRVVPTWNYQRVEVRGRLRVETDPARLRPLVARLTDQMEAHEARPWAVSDAPDAYVSAMCNGIVGVRLSVERVEASWKLSQNKSSDDFAGVMQTLAKRTDPGARAIAAAMSTLPPSHKGT